MSLFADGYNFTLADGVTRIPVRYTNRYGIEIIADLDTATDLDQSTKAVATFAMYDISRVNQQGWSFAVIGPERHTQLEAYSQQRWPDVEADTRPCSLTSLWRCRRRAESDRE